MTLAFFFLSGYTSCNPAVWHRWATELVRSLVMNIVEEHTSPDGFLRLIVTRDEDGDVSIGFDKYAWHTHGDILASLSGKPENEAIREFVQHVMSEGQIIAISRINGEVEDVWPTDDPIGEFKYKPSDEVLEFRRWSGAMVDVKID